MKSQEMAIEIAGDGRLFCKRRQTAMRKTAFRTPKDGKTEGDLRPFATPPVTHWRIANRAATKKNRAARGVKAG